jgi:Zn ribbon nucleic-acid-binding protein
MNLTRLYAERICPVCGHKLDFVPWEGNEFQERACPCCGIHFGYDDRIESNREKVYLAWRQHWIDNDKRWWGKNPPPDYKPDEQLAYLERLES